MRQRNSERGDLLISTLLAMAIVMVMLAAIVPSVIRKAQIDNADGASQTLNAIGTANFLYASKYGAFIAPNQLVGNLAATGLQPCQNPFGFLMGSQSTAPRGYVMTFTPGAVQASFTCPGVAGYSSFEIKMDPRDRLEASRHFYFSSVDSEIHFNDSQQASIGDPQYALPANLVGGTGGSSNNQVGGQGFVTVWSPMSYQIGAEVTRAASISGDNCGPAQNGQVGIFILLSGTGSDDPCVTGGSPNWFYTGNPANLSHTAASTGTLSWTLTGSQAVVPAGQAISLIPVNNSVQGPSHFSNLSVSFSSPLPLGGVVNIAIVDGSNSNQFANPNMYCSFENPHGVPPYEVMCAMNENNTGSGPSWVSCGGVTNGWSLQNPFVANPGDQLFVGIAGCSSIGSSYSLGNITVTLNP